MRKFHSLQYLLTQYTPTATLATTVTVSYNTGLKPSQLGWPGLYNIHIWSRCCIRSCALITASDVLIEVMSQVCMTVMMEVYLLILLKSLEKVLIRIQILATFLWSFIRVALINTAWKMLHKSFSRSHIDAVYVCKSTCNAYQCQCLINTQYFTFCSCKVSLLLYRNK